VKALVKTSMMIALLRLVLSVMAAFAPEMARIATSPKVPSRINLTKL
jgi:hypothetical protein